MTHDERRIHARIESDLPCAVASDEGSNTGRLRNLSYGGGLLSQLELPSAGHWELSLQYASPQRITVSTDTGTGWRLVRPQRPPGALGWASRLRRGTRRPCARGPPPGRRDDRAQERVRYGPFLTGRVRSWEVGWNAPNGVRRTLPPQ